MTAYFVAGVGTGVGKTFTTCALLHAAKCRNIKAHGYKPVISGWDEGSETDTAKIIAAAETKELVDAVSPWRFTAPLSPHRAAFHENKILSFDVLLDWTQMRIEQPGITLIESVGGLMVPLTDSQTTLDWMEALPCKIILVTGSYLGSINHTLLSLKVLEGAGLEVAALVMNESLERSVGFAEAQAGLEPFIQHIPLRIFQPRVSSVNLATEIAGLVQHL